MKWYAVFSIIISVTITIYAQVQWLERNKNSIVHVIPYDENGNRIGHGSGIIIKKNQNDSDLEFFLPDAVNILISTKKIRIKVRVTEEEWFGITFPEDSIQVKKNIKQLITRGIYPGNL